jgi:uncharacterized protein YecE (DUF72 family)
MRLLAGTSGFSYKEWIGTFYPPKLPAKSMLEFYASKLPAVEINNTFYRMPTPALLEGWRAAVPDSFRFAVKVPRRISHLKRLRGCVDDVRHLDSTLAALAPCVGSMLVQLPPYFKLDCDALRDFLAELPTGRRFAFEFRHESWLVPQVFDLLREHGCALVQSENDAEFQLQPWTARFAYLRLRKIAYRDDELRRWLDRLQAAGLDEAQVFFKHEDEGTGPKLAERLLALAGKA